MIYENARSDSDKILVTVSLMDRYDEAYLISENERVCERDRKVTHELRPRTYKLKYLSRSVGSADRVPRYLETSRMSITHNQIVGKPYARN